MKKFFLVGLFLLTATTAFAASSGPFTRVVLPAEHIYVPKGFDDNDEAEILVSTYLPNICYESPKTEVNVIGKEVHIKITAMKDQNPNRICVEMIKPVLEKVRVGVLAAGDYKVFVASPSTIAAPVEEKIAIVAAATSSIDDYVYANVDKIETLKDNKALLRGYNPSDCYVLDEIRIFDNEKDVYAILPIMKQIRETCPMKMIPFEYQIEIPNKLVEPKILLHVRALGGHSANAIYYRE